MVRLPHRPLARRWIRFGMVRLLHRPLATRWMRFAMVLLPHRPLATHWIRFTMVRLPHRSLATRRTRLAMVCLLRRILAALWTSPCYGTPVCWTTRSIRPSWRRILASNPLGCLSLSRLLPVCRSFISRTQNPGRELHTSDWRFLYRDEIPSAFRTLSLLIQLQIRFLFSNARLILSLSLLICCRHFTPTWHQHVVASLAQQRVVLVVNLLSIPTSTSRTSVASQYYYS
jgi:hypothetical protein